MKLKIIRKDGETSFFLQSRELVELGEKLSGGVFYPGTEYLYNIEQIYRAPFYLLDRGHFFRDRLSNVLITRSYGSVLINTPLLFNKKIGEGVCYSSGLANLSKNDLLSTADILADLFKHVFYVMDSYPEWRIPSWKPDHSLNP